MVLTAIDAASPGFALRYASPELRADLAEEKRNSAVAVLLFRINRVFRFGARLGGADPLKL